MKLFLVVFALVLLQATAHEETADAVDEAGLTKFGDVKATTKDVFMKLQETINQYKTEDDREIPKKMNGKKVTQKQFAWSSISF